MSVHITTKEQTNFLLESLKRIAFDGVLMHWRKGVKLVWNIRICTKQVWLVKVLTIFRSEWKKSKRSIWSVTSNSNFLFRFDSSFRAVAHKEMREDGYDVEQLIHRKRHRGESFFSLIVGFFTGKKVNYIALVFINSSANNTNFRTVNVNNFSQLSNIPKNHPRQLYKNLPM